MVDVRDVAKWFLSKESMTHKKLQKLCYYAQAWYCALYNGEPLFADEIQAWVHGPVIPTIYPIYADFKWNEIPSEPFDETEFSDNVLNALNAVYDTYSELNGDQLERLTHSEVPWIEARGELEPWEASTSSISRITMRKYYGQKYEENQND